MHTCSISPKTFLPELSCCLPLEYPVETALHTIDFLMEDVDGSESAMLAYNRLLNCGFRPVPLVRRLS